MNYKEGEKVGEAQRRERGSNRETETVTEARDD